MEEPVGAEVAEIVAGYGYDVARRYRPWLLPRWDDFKGQILDKLFRDRADKKLREDETLFALARRLVKAEGDKEVGALKKESAGLSFDDTTVGAVPRDVLETSVTLSSPSRFKNPERAVAERELRDWLISAVGALDEGSLETFAKEWALCHGEYETLGQALGVNESTARSRLLRFRRELGAFAETTGAVDLAEQLDSRAKGRPAPPLRAQKEKPTRPGHRLEELVRYRAGLLAPVERGELEKHFLACEECLRSLRALDVTRDVFRVALDAPMGPWDPERVAAELQKKYPRRRLSKAMYWLGLALLAVGAAVVAWLLHSPPEKLPIQPVPTRSHLESAPIAPPVEDAGADSGR
jgi:DNA-directed RNA polymerase specialized sigma24 family protein